LNLTLVQNGLSGSIPDEFSRLSPPSLRRLDLSYNPGLVGTLPAVLLGNLTDLEVLSLSNCGLGGRVPLSLGGLENLIDLNLSANNGFNGTLPSELSNLKKLERVHLSGNRFSGRLNPNISQSLEYLDFSDNLVRAGIDVLSSLLLGHWIWLLAVGYES